MNPRHKDKEPDEIIKLLRHEILIHSCLYYWLDRPIIKNWRWDELASQLIEYQRAFPECTQVNFFDEDFDGFTMKCGIGLPYDDHDIIIQANLLLNSLTNSY